MPMRRISLAISARLKQLSEDIVISSTKAAPAGRLVFLCPQHGLLFYSIFRMFRMSTQILI